MKYKINSPKKISSQSWQRLVDVLGEGHYKRYDESTAQNMLDMAALLEDKYSGKIGNPVGREQKGSGRTPSGNQRRRSKSY